MAYTQVWDNTQPLGTAAANTIDDIFRSVKTDIQERFTDIFAMPNFTADPLRPYGLKFTDAQDAVINLGDNAGTARNLSIKNKTGVTTYFTFGQTSLDIVGALNLTINTNKFTVAGASGNTIVAGTLGVTGLTSVVNLTATGTITLTGATITGSPTWSNNQAITLSTAAQPNVTSVGTLISLAVTGAITSATLTTTGAIQLADAQQVQWAGSNNALRMNGGTFQVYASTGVQIIGGTSSTFSILSNTTAVQALTSISFTNTSTGASSGARFINTNAGAGTSVITLEQTTASTYNWAIATNYDALGEIGLRSSNASNGDPIAAGTSVFRLSRLGALIIAAGFTGTSITLSADSSIAATKKFFLDGGGDSYLIETSANQIDIFAGAVNTIRTTTSVVSILSADFQIPAAKKLFIDGGGDTYIWEVSANQMQFMVGGVQYLLLNSNSANLANGTGQFNTGFNGQQYGSGLGVLGIGNANTNPSTNPVGGGVLYANAGAGTWRGSGGTVTAFAPA